MTTLKWPSKDPNEVKDYSIYWGNRLGTDTIASSVWTVVTVGGTLVLGTQTYTDDTSTVWLSAGANGATYKLLNRVVTTGGRTYDHTAPLDVRDS